MFRLPVVRNSIPSSTRLCNALRRGNVAGAAIVLFLGCVGGDGPTEHAVPLAAPGGTVTLLEEVVVDGEREQFSVPSGFVLVDSAGGMYFGDRRGFSMRAYDRTGRHRFDFGRRGDGPGEFVGRRKISTFRGGMVGDSIWVYDPDGRRVTVISRAGRLLRTARVPEIPNVRDPVTQQMLGASFSPLALRRDGGMIGVRSVVLGASPRIVHDDIVALGTNGTVRKIAERPSDHRLRVTDARSGKSVVVPIPGAPHPLMAVSQNGELIAFVEQRARSDHYDVTITMLDATGDTILTVARPVTSGGPLTSEMRASNESAARRDYTAANRAGRVPLYPPSLIESIFRAQRDHAVQTRAPVRTLQIGLDGTLWLGLSPEAGSLHFLILNQRGDSSGYLMPPVPYERFYASAHSRSHLWAMVSDTDGAPSLVRYRLLMK